MVGVIKMNEQQYQKLLSKIRKSKQKERVFTFLCQYSPVSLIIIYTLLICYLFFTQSSLLLETIFFPLFTLILTTVLRKIINAPRPYDIYQIEPLIKHHSGQSFPSRHTSSAWIIAYACLNVNTVLGIFCIFIALYVAMSRVIAGVHFIKDVIAGILLSSLVGLFLFLV